MASGVSVHRKTVDLSGEDNDAVQDVFVRDLATTLASSAVARTGAAISGGRLRGIVTGRIYACGGSRRITETSIFMALHLG